MQVDRGTCMCKSYTQNLFLFWFTSTVSADGRNKKVTAEGFGQQSGKLLHLRLQGAIAVCRCQQRFWRLGLWPRNTGELFNTIGYEGPCSCFRQRDWRQVYLPAWHMQPHKKAHAHLKKVQSLCSARSWLHMHILDISRSLVMFHVPLRAACVWS